MLMRNHALAAACTGVLLCGGVTAWAGTMPAPPGQDDVRRQDAGATRVEQMRKQIVQTLAATGRQVADDLPYRGGAGARPPASQPATGEVGRQDAGPTGARSSASQPAAADDAAVRSEYENLVKTQAPALVRIKYVQQTQGASGDYEAENEIIGVMLEPTGLVMCSNTRLGASRGRFRSGRSTPTKIKVLVGDDTEGLDARFLARDTELDLAWIQIDEVQLRRTPPGDRRFACVDLSAAEEPALGQRMLTLGVMGKYFGEAVLVSEGRLAGRTHKPRELYVFRGSLDTDPGLPIFTSAGRLVGFATLQRPEADEVSGDMSAMTTRGWGLILPAATVAKATAQAKEVKAGGGERGRGGDQQTVTGGVGGRRLLTPSPSSESWW